MGRTIWRDQSRTKRTREERRKRYLRSSSFVQGPQRTGGFRGKYINQNHRCFQTDIDVAQGSERLKTPGSFVVTTSRDKTIMLWDVSSGQHLKTFVSI
jgi:hypothetical protein